MIVTFPANTITYIAGTTAVVITAFWFVWSQGLKQLSFKESVKRNWKWGAAIVLMLWVAVRIELLLSNRVTQAAAYTRTSLMLGLLLGTLPIFLPQFRQIVRAIPQLWLVGIQTIRIGGFVFLALLDMKLLPPAFALPAGIGDMTVAILALGVMYAIARQKPYARNITIAWSLLGLLDFVIALATGLLYIGPYAARVAQSGISLQYLNYVLLIPSVLVPLFTLMHFYLLYQVVSRQSDKQVIKDPTFA